MDIVDPRLYFLANSLDKLGYEYSNSPNSTYLGFTLSANAEILDPFFSLNFGIRHDEDKPEWNSALLLFATTRLFESTIEGDALAEVLERVARVNGCKASSAAETGVWVLGNDSDRYTGFISYRVTVPDEIVKQQELLKLFLDDLFAYGKKVKTVILGEAPFEPVLADAGTGEIYNPEPAVTLEKSDEVTEVVTAEEVAVAPSDVAPSQRVTESVAVQAPEQAQNTGASQLVSDSSDSAGSKKQGTKASDIVFIILSFLFPIIGIVLYFLWKESNPKLGKKVLIAALVAIAIYILPVIF